MTIASDLLHRHIQTLVEDHTQWQTLIADDLVWELPYAPAIGHPARLSGRDEVVRHVTWFLGRCSTDRSSLRDPDRRLAEARIKPTGRLYHRCDVFCRLNGALGLFWLCRVHGSLHAWNGRITH